MPTVVATRQEIDASNPSDVFMHGSYTMHSISEASTFVTSRLVSCV